MHGRTDGHGRTCARAPRAPPRSEGSPRRLAASRASPRRTLAGQRAPLRTTASPRRAHEARFPTRSGGAAGRHPHPTTRRAPCGKGVPTGPGDLGNQPPPRSVPASMADCPRTAFHAEGPAQNHVLHLVSCLFSLLRLGTFRSLSWTLVPLTRGGHRPAVLPHVLVLPLATVPPAEVWDASSAGTSQSRGLAGRPPQGLGWSLVGMHSENRPGGPCPASPPSGRPSRGQ